jgi:hypothetical protein
MSDSTIQTPMPVPTLPTTSDTNTLLQMYIDSLNEKENMAYNIAKSHLGSSFSLEKSNGFLEWKKTQNI